MKHMVSVLTIIALILVNLATPAAATDGDPVARYKACWGWIQASMTKIIEDDPKTPLIVVEVTTLIGAYDRALILDAAPDTRMAVLLEKCDKIRRKSEAR
ncbi:MAG: hypothetical protein OXF79_03550 [Chloroflexi bacterium]|nr:hypothetical protein [Chloroflexota bacterium]